jgi:hypothetical protein
MENKNTKGFSENPGPKRNASATLLVYTERMPDSAILDAPQLGNFHQNYQKNNIIGCVDT